MKENLRKEGINREERIKKKSQFNIIFKSGKKIDSEKLKIYFVKNDKNISRFNTVTGRKLGNAVLRNRIRRIFKEVYRRNKGYFGGNIDWVFIPKGRWEKIDYYFAETLILDVIKRIKERKNFFKI